MSRDLRLYLMDMLEAIARIKRYLHTVDFDTFCRDEMRIDAVLRNLEILGEATKQIPPAQRKLAPEIEWRRVAGLRDIIIHQYFGLSLAIVWDIVENHVPPLEQSLIRLLADLERES